MHSKSTNFCPPPDRVRFECVGKMESYLGKGGTTVHEIEEECSVKINRLELINMDKDGGDELFGIYGPVPAIERAYKLICQIQKENSKMESFFVTPNIHNKTSERIIVRSDQVGKIIGTAGKNIKLIQQESGTIMTKHDDLDHPGQSSIEIFGRHSAIQYAKRLLKNLMDDDHQRLRTLLPTKRNDNIRAFNSNQSHGNFSKYNGRAAMFLDTRESHSQTFESPWIPNMEPKIDQPTGKIPDAIGSDSGDFTVQWVDYYRSRGMHEQAAALEQLSKDDIL